MVDIKIKLVNGNTKLPFKGSDGAAGVDLYANSYEYDYEHDAHIYGTGICIQSFGEVEAQVRPRSSVYKVDAIMGNTPGTVDPDYRGEIYVVFKNRNSAKWYNKILYKLGILKTANKTPYALGERIAQLVFNKIERPNFIVVPELDSTERGEGKHGSTGK